MADISERRSIFSTVEARFQSDWGTVIKSLHKEKADTRKNEVSLSKKIENAQKPMDKLRDEIRSMKSQLSTAINSIGSATAEELELNTTIASADYQNAWDATFDFTDDIGEIDWGEVVSILRELKSIRDNAKTFATYHRKIVVLSRAIPDREKKIPIVEEEIEQEKNRLVKELAAERRKIAPIIKSIDSDLDYARDNNVHCNKSISLSRMRQAGASLRQLQDNKW